MQPSVRLQPHLGKPSENYKPHDAMGGYMALAKITKVHHKHGTVDVQIIKSNNRISSSSDNEGKYGVRVGTSSAHFDGVTMASSGVVEPLQEGQWVVLAYLDNSKTEPIIVCSFHNTWEMSRNILPTNYPLNPQDSVEDYREALKYLRVFPSQAYLRVDGIGAMEYSHPSGTFFAMEPEGFGKSLGDGHEEYTHADLHEKDPVTGQTRSAKTEDALFPVSMLLHHQCVGGVSIKSFFDRFGAIRTTKDPGDGTLTYYSIGVDGEFVARRQLDSSDHEGGSNTSEIKIEETGKMSMKRVNGKSTEFTIEDDGSAHMKRGTTSITISSSGDVSLTHPKGTVTLNNGGVSINSQDEFTITHPSGSFIQLANNGDIIIKPARNLVTS